MRIVYFHQYFATRDSATGTRSFELAKRLAARGHEVTIVSSAALLPRDQGAGAARVRPFVRDRVEGIDLLLLNVPYSNYFSYAKRLAAFALFTAEAGIAGPLLPRPDVVFASSTPLTIGIPGLLTARLRRAPFVFELRDLWPEVPIAIGALRSRPLIAAARRLEALLYAGAARIVVLSEASRDALLARGVPAGKLVFVPNACDLDLFRPDNVDHEFRARHGLTGKFVALYSGAMGRANGIDQLIDAAVALRAAGRDDVAIVAVGDGGRRPHLDDSARRLGLDNLHVLGPLPKQALAGVVGAADVDAHAVRTRPHLRDQLAQQVLRLAGRRPAGGHQPRRLAAPRRGRRARRPVRAGRRRRRPGRRPGRPGRRARPGGPHGGQRAAAGGARVLPRRAGRPPLRGARRGRPGHGGHARQARAAVRARGAPMTPAPAGFYVRRGKRLFDLAAAGVGGALATPLLAGLAATVYLTSGRPVLFVQDRVGRDGAVFGMYKFRSMIPDAVEHGAGLYVEEDDDRITWAGRWLRAFSLDELPSS